VGKLPTGSANNANSAFHPSWVGESVVILVFTWNTGTIKNSRPGLHAGLHAQAMSAGLQLRPKLNDSPVTHSAAKAACGTIKVNLTLSFSILNCLTLTGE